MPPPGWVSILVRFSRRAAELEGYVNVESLQREKPYLITCGGLTWGIQGVLPFERPRGNKRLHPKAAPRVGRARR